MRDDIDIETNFEKDIEKDIDIEKLRKSIEAERESTPLVTGSGGPANTNTKANSKF